jgi:glycerophosphoryl diester phosphodiesterase family protein
MTPTSHSPGSFAKSTVIVGSARPQPPRFVLRRRHVVRAGAIVLALVLIYICGYEPAYHGTLVVRAPRPLIFANQAAGDGVERALDAGLDGGYVDAQLTDEGQLMIADRKSGSVRRFEDVVRAVNRRGAVLVDLRSGGAGSAGIEQRAVDIIRRFDAHLSVVLGSFNPVVLYRVKQIDPLVRTAFIFTDTEQDDAADLPWALRQEFVRRAIRKFVGYDMLSIDHQVDEAVIDRLIAKGWPAFIWTPDTEADIRRAVAKRPYGVISNQPILARQLRGE